MLQKGLGGTENIRRKLLLSSFIFVQDAVRTSTIERTKILIERLVEITLAS